jgi:outer membrane protein OmpA-like peptidoglycan-associated protein
MRRCFLALYLAGLAIFANGQNGQIQKPGEIQQPKGTWQVPGKFQTPGDIQKVKEQCMTRLTVGSDALFEFNKADLTPAAETELSQLGPLIQKEGNHPIAIEGYTDSIGSVSYNQELSEKRARAVAGWLEAHHFATESSIHVQGFGKNKPVAPNAKSDGSDNPDGRQKNRRVEVVINTCK